ncbi:maleylpyruvate isomerase family mycothiol-dependent enzyme [Paractinoplanes rishiriensis]|uniref:Mycothiol-dependent maleylpyruvate isomerase metal-binding domain-containing protein n=1 Tax=Paractinoplanes rishiriensis TaxID=1050105 RepID=A0A919MVI2_9ACTN|nr:maleylpyruvate isomerase family mycothiol-dependent enzyme [Actinoplanes rishiriensis]GIE96848.1 hypothetical protein Ari01nite_43130 [Actinoplanes rishiriensis]
MSWLAPERYAAELEAETARLAAAAAGQFPEAVVPACPEWTVRDLVTHVGSGHRLAAGIIEARRDSPAPYRLVDAPDDPAEWAGWLASGARRLTDAVRDLGFDGRVWTWQPQHQTAGFWLRRMVHDLIIHRFDADEIDHDVTGGLAPDLAADGIADMLLVFEIVGKFAGDGERLQFTATDTGDGWHATLDAGGLSWRAGTAPADVTVSAPVTDLLLVLNRRREPAAVEGDRELFDRWWAITRF